MFTSSFTAPQYYNFCKLALKLRVVGTPEPKEKIFGLDVKLTDCYIYNDSSRGGCKGICIPNETQLRYLSLELCAEQINQQTSDIPICRAIKHGYRKSL